MSYFAENNLQLKLKTLPLHSQKVFENIKA